jgi:crotonobetainyl-CoA:carnitine CoA-transferase CaiB-like acyl-CoA transferase
MRQLLVACLNRPYPPADDDVTISAQLWRVYDAALANAGGAPTPPPQLQARDIAGARMSAPAGAADDDNAPAAITKSAEGHHAASTQAAGVAPGHEKADVAAGGLLNPPSRLQEFGYRVREVVAAALGRPMPPGVQQPCPATGKPPASHSKAPASKLAIDAERILSEIGILFVEGFETTGHTIGWAALNIATAPGERARVGLCLQV